ncbi:hypothetical protein GLOIN_2v1477631 [Rhizophagus clarus]|uniref:Uncharacterized protein n=1 Tax=Rhizophagus clarus TaxID=94130 RepID=A0A8H3M7Y4_9GLOM|nr:hypothetical protein GLOIN_2v1477631 [Rhizophagus clarus]
MLLCKNQFITSKNTKQELWEKFHEKYPNEVKRTTFYKHLQESIIRSRREVKMISEREYESHLTVIESLEIKPDWVTFLSDNDSHYHNADLMLILEHWSEWDCGTSVAYLESERKENQDEKEKFIPENSNWYEWFWPTEGQVLNHTFDFALPSEWALKENQKFGKKEGAQEMHNELKGLVEERVLEEKEIPKISTISNWIA